MVHFFSSILEYYKLDLKIYYTLYIISRHGHEFNIITTRLI